MIAARNRRPRRRARRNPTLSDRFKPQTLSDLVGGEFIQRYLRGKAVDPDYDRDRLLITGESGTGKTSAAEIIALVFAQNDESLVRQMSPRPGFNIIPVFEDHFRSKRAADLRARGRASEIEDDGIFEFSEVEVESTVEGVPIPWHIGIIDQAERLDEDEQIMLQNLMDLQPSHTMMLLTSTAPEGLEEQLRNRFRIFPLDRPSEDRLADLVQLAAADGFDPPIPVTRAEALGIARASRGGGFRKALDELDTAIGAGKLRSGKVIKVRPDGRRSAAAAAVDALNLAEQGVPIHRPVPSLIQPGPAAVVTARPSVPLEPREPVGPFDFRTPGFVARVKGRKEFKRLKAGAERNGILETDTRIVEGLVVEEDLKNFMDFRRLANRLARGAAETSARRRQAAILRAAAREMSGTAGKLGKAKKSKKKAAANPATRVPWKRQAVFFKKSVFTPREARAWLRENMKAKPAKGARRATITFKGRGEFFGWDLRRLPAKSQRNRLRWVPFGKDIMVRFIAPGKRAPRQAVKNARRTVRGNKTIATSSRGPFNPALSIEQLFARRVGGAIKNPGGVTGLFPKPPPEKKPSIRARITKLTKGAINTLGRFVTKASRAQLRRKGKLTGQKNVAVLMVRDFNFGTVNDPDNAFAVFDLNNVVPGQRAGFQSVAGTIPGTLVSGRFGRRNEATSQMNKLATALRKLGFKVRTVSTKVGASARVIGSKIVRALKNPATTVSVGRTAKGFVLVDQRGKRIPGFDPYKTRAGAQKHVREVQAEVNPANPSRRSSLRRAEFLDNGQNVEDLITQRIHIADTRIPLTKMILLGNHRQLNYSAPKFRGRKWREYKHRPDGFSREATKLTNPDGGLAFLHPEGAYILIVPSAKQRRITMDKRGLLN